MVLVVRDKRNMWVRKNDRCFADGTPAGGGETEVLRS